MQYARLGDTGLIVSRLSFGAMTFSDPGKPHAIYKVDTGSADRLVGRAFDAGVNFFDTADVYAEGVSETMLGQALRTKRKDVVIATKVGFRMGKALTEAGLSRRHIHWSVDQSLKRLGSDWIDLYIVHKEDPVTPLEETLEALDAVVRAGKVRYIGFSNWSAWKVAAAREIQRARGYAAFTSGQLYYSLLCRDVERDLVPMMARYGMGLTAWSPLAGGYLSGKYTAEAFKDPKNRLALMNLLPFDRELGARIVTELAAIAGRRNATVAQAALAWLLAKPGVTSIIMGASRIDQLEDNLAADNVRLTGEEVAALDEITKFAPAYPNWFSAMMADAAQRDALAPR